MEDLIVVGAGPAGAATALGALQARPSARVVLLDKAAFPRDKACGDGVAPHAIDVLHGLGVRGVTHGYPPVHRLEARAPSGRSAATTMRRPSHVIPRAVLDARIVDAAVAAGAVLEQARVREVVDRGTYVEVDGRPARICVAADGAGSRVRRSLGADANDDRHLAVAVRGYAPAPAGPPHMRILMEPDGWPAYSWSFPIGDGRVNVGYGLLRAALGGGGRDRLHRHVRRLAPEVESASLRAHHLPFSTQRPAPAQGRVLLAGDAASFINPLSGEGIYYAVASGALAGAAAVRDPAGAGRRYQLQLRGLLRRHFRHTALLARVIRAPWVVERGVRAAGRNAGAFDDLVDLALGDGVLSSRLALAVLRG